MKAKKIERGKWYRTGTKRGKTFKETYYGPQWFVSIDSMSEAIGRAKDTQEAGQSPSPAHLKYGPSGSQVDYNGAEKLFNQGWPEGIDGLVKLSGINNAGKVARRGKRKKPHYYGKMISAERFSAGHPRPFIHQMPAPHKNPAVRIGVQINANAGMGAECIKNRGASALGLITALEQQGIPVELWCFSCQENKDEEYRLIEVLAKRSNEPMNINNLAFAMGHQGFWMHQWSALYGHMHHEGHGCFGYACAINLDAEHSNHYDIVTPYDESLLRSTEKCKQWAQDMADKLTKR